MEVLQGSGEIKKAVGVSVRVLKKWISDWTKAITALSVCGYAAKPARSIWVIVSIAEVTLPLQETFNSKEQL